MFKIEFIEGGKPLNNESYEPNLRITIGNHIEYVETDTSYWKKKDFEKQWLRSLKRFLEGASSVTLFVSMNAIYEAVTLEAWVLYEDKNNPENVFVQNCLISRKEILKCTSQSELIDRTDKHETHSQNGDPISEWTTTRTEISAWSDRLNKLLSE